MSCYYSNDEFMSSFLPIDETQTLKVEKKDDKKNYANDDDDGGDECYNEEIVKKPENNVYDATFAGHTLIIGATNSGKTTIIINLIRAGIIRNKKIVWVSSRELPESERESLVSRLSRHGATISISTAKDKTQLSTLLEQCRRAGEKYTEGPILLVLDDMMSLTYQNSIFDSLQVEGRHFNIELVTTYQVVHQRRGNWNVSKGGARQIIITRLGSQANAITNLLAAYIAAHTAVS